MNKSRRPKTQVTGIPTKNHPIVNTDRFNYRQAQSQPNTRLINAFFSTIKVKKVLKLSIKESKIRTKCTNHKSSTKQRFINMYEAEMGNRKKSERSPKVKACATAFLQSKEGAMIHGRQIFSKNILYCFTKSINFPAGRGNSSDDNRLKKSPSFLSLNIKQCWNI